MNSPAALLNWIPLAGIALAFFSTLSVLAVWRSRFASAGPRSESELGRSPGQALRDALSRAGLDAAEYAALKHELAARFPRDRMAYLDGKTEFVRRVLAAADLS